MYHDSPVAEICGASDGRLNIWAAAGAAVSDRRQTARIERMASLFAFLGAAIAGRRRDAVQPQIHDELTVDVVGVLHREVDDLEARRRRTEEWHRRDALGELGVVE